MKDNSDPTLQWLGHRFSVYVCTVTLNLKILTWVKVMTHPWVVAVSKLGVMGQTQNLVMCVL